IFRGAGQGFRRRRRRLWYQKVQRWSLFFLTMWSGGLAKKWTLEGLLLEVFLAGGVGRFQGRGFGDRDIPPAGAIRCVDKRVGVDVDEGGLVRSFGGSHGLLQVFDGVLPGLDFNDIKAVAAGIHGQVNGQDLLALEVLLFFVVLAVPGTKALRTNGFGQVADGSIAVVLD